MKSKQEVIQEAWGKHWNTVSNHHQYDGWVKRWAWDFRIELEMEELNHYDNTPDLVRPKSLAGLETNNGWIRLESEEDLPKESGKYWVTYKDVRYKQDQEVFYVGKGWDCFLDVTHYQPIIKPLPPIY